MSVIKTNPQVHVFLAGGHSSGSWAGPSAQWSPVGRTSGSGLHHAEPGPPRSDLVLRGSWVGPRGSCTPSLGALSAPPSHLSCHVLLGTP